MKIKSQENQILDFQESEKINFELRKINEGFLEKIGIVDREIYSLKREMEKKTNSLKENQIKIEFILSENLKLKTEIEEVNSVK